MEVIVEVLDATGLMAKNGQGSSNPFVEVEFDGQRQRTRTKLNDLAPSWNETLFFHLSDPSRLPSLAINIIVLHEVSSGAAASNPRSSGNLSIRRRFLGASRKPKNAFLGHARLSGNAISDSTGDSIKTLVLTKKGLFSNVRGEVTIRVTIDELDEDPPDLLSSSDNENFPSNHNSVVNTRLRDEQRAFSTDSDTLVVRKRLLNEYSVGEICPKVAALLGNSNCKKSGPQYDLVERMEFLYVHVGKARGLPINIIPFVQITLGKFRGYTCTKIPDENQEAQWSQVLVFPIENILSCLLQVFIWDRRTNELVGCALLDLSKFYSEKSSRCLKWFEMEDFYLEPRWYGLQGQPENKVDGEVMLSMGIDTQANKAFCGAVHAHHGMLSEGSRDLIRPMVYYSPELAYLRVFVAGAEDLVSDDPLKLTNASLRVQVGQQRQETSPVMIVGSAKPEWNKELMFVVSQSSYLVEPITITVVANGKEEIGSIAIPISSIPVVSDLYSKPPEPKWYNLSKYSRSATYVKVQLRLSVDLRYHVLHESLQQISDFQPTARNLARPCIGTIELGIIGAEKLQAMTCRNGQWTADAYCVAKYGPKWARTRTILDSVDPKWNEQYAWDVFEPCTVITIGVLNNCTLGTTCRHGDCQIGKVKIRLSTLESGKIYSNSYPLIELSKSGIKKKGNLQLTVRFTCTDWARIVALYGKPLLPETHYLEPINEEQLWKLNQAALEIIVSHMSRSHPALSRNIVKYMIGSNEMHLFWNFRYFNTNLSRSKDTLSCVIFIWRWLKDIKSWKNPKITILVNALFLVLVWRPWLIPSCIFFSLFVIGVWNYRFRPKHPLHTDLIFSNAMTMDSDELDEELDTFPTTRSFDIIRRRYAKLRSIAAHFMKVVDNLAALAERLDSILRWRDPRATFTCITLLFVLTTIFCAVPFGVIVTVTGLCLLNCPISSRGPSMLENFFERLPERHEELL